ncbi:MAG: hypothetical protein H7174_00445, partial [Flavobacterium sp.]|nr:hypothetical protein [Flavobacterium sp.]
KLKLKANFTNDVLNIEGSFFYNNRLYFLNRGNGLLNNNGVFIYDKENENIDYEIYQLPKINNFETSFTDGIFFENKMYFLATAENTTSTYLDGEIYGSLIGIIDLKTMKIDSFLKISENQKFEGLTFYSKNQNEINFLLCEDNDTEVLVSNIYKLTINLS